MSYDYAILGGGAAGLSLALALVRSPLRAGSILIVEKDAKNTNDRTWCFWSDAPTPLDDIAYHTWPNLRFRSPGVERTYALAPFRYQMVRGLDFYRAAHAELEQHNVTFVQASAEVQDGQERAIVQAGGREFVTAWAFDSRIRPEDMLPEPRYNTLKQHFTGWELETQAPVFDPQTATLFDLRTPQRGGVTFFYILPFSPRRALVEYTLFSPDLLPAQEYDLALQAYLRDELKAEDYRILQTEHGVIPMTDRPFPRRLGQRVMAIGTRGGRVKPSTGYAFARIQRDSARIVNSLVKLGNPFAVPADPLRQRFYERLSLDVMAHAPDGGRAVFSGIFRRNPIQLVLRFLDDRSSIIEDLRVISACPPLPFLKAFLRLVEKKKNEMISSPARLSLP